MKERGDGGASQRAEEIEGPSSRELEVSSRESVERSVTCSVTRDGRTILNSTVLRMAFRNARIPRLTLFSGPNCSLCDVRQMQT